MNASDIIICADILQYQQSNYLLVFSMLLFTQYCKYNAIVESAVIMKVWLTFNDTELFIELTINLVYEQILV